MSPPLKLKMNGKLYTHKRKHTYIYIHTERDVIVSGLLRSLVKIHKQKEKKKVKNGISIIRNLCEKTFL